MKKLLKEYSENWEEITGLDYENTVPSEVNKLDFINGVKWQQEQDKNLYSEEELLRFGKSCFYKGFDKAENDDENCYTAFREEISSLFEKFKME